MRHKIAMMSVAGLVLSDGMMALTTSAAAPKKPGADHYLKNVQTKGLKFQRIGRMSFAKQGILLIADTGNGSPSPGRSCETPRS